MTPMTYQTFEANALARGFDEVLERKWAPNAIVGEHAHPFDADALVVQGELWLTVNDVTRHLRPGDTFNLDANIVHSERYGAEGSSFWVARRHVSKVSAG